MRLVRSYHDPMRFVYFMPPIQYPDGKHYVKIGHSKGQTMPNDGQSLTRWFQGDGDPERIEWLTDTLYQLLPEAEGQVVMASQLPT